jgi:LysR family transcriptional activator of nhaA
MKAFGEAGAGIFTSPTAAEEDIISKHDTENIGRTAEVEECYHAISA